MSGKLYLTTIVIICISIFFISRHYQKKLSILEENYSVLSSNVIRNASIQILINSQMDRIVSNQCRLADNSTQLASNVIDHLKDRSLHITPWQFQSFTNFWRMDTNNIYWYIDKTGGEYQITLPQYYGNTILL